MPLLANSGKVVRQWSLMPTIFLVLGIVSIAMLVLTNGIGNEQRIGFKLADVATDIQIKTAGSYGQLEEMLAGRETLDAGSVLGYLDSAIELTDVILSGGLSDGIFLEPTQDASLRKEAENLKALLTRFRESSEKRYSLRGSSGQEPDLDRQFYQLYNQVMKKARGVETLIEDGLVSRHGRLNQLSSGILVVWIALVLTATSVLWTRERRRKATEHALQQTNEQLMTQAKELSRHRLHLLELVDERTSELLDSNKELQQEILERKRAVEALQESKDKFERLSLVFNALLDAIPDALTLLSPELRVKWANRGAAAMFGRPTSDLIGQECCNLWNIQSVAGYEYPAITVFRTGRAESGLFPAPDGSIRDIRVVPIEDARGNTQNVIEIATDVTEKMNLQEEAQRVAHLASLGELAAGVAHEINNPINGIINYAQILLDECETEGNEGGIPREIIREGNRIAAIVKSLLSFAHGQKTEKMPVRIHEVLSDTLRLSGKQLEKDGIVTSLKVPGDLPEILANHQQIEQVFLNIINNARYALNQKYPAASGNKLLDISLKEVRFKGNRGVNITFHDSGTGIPAAIIKRVRDPFFSTKPKGVGTGLGLSISHGIISDHGGRLLIDSVEGESTTVQVIFGVRGQE